MFLSQHFTEAQPASRNTAEQHVTILQAVCLSLFYPLKCDLYISYSQRENTSFSSPTSLATGSFEMNEGRWIVATLPFWFTFSIA